MSDEHLRDLERRYQETGDDNDLLALLQQLEKREPLPCPTCSRRGGAALGSQMACSWCGTRWHARPARNRAKELRASLGRPRGQSPTRARPAVCGERGMVGCPLPVYQYPGSDNDMCLGHMIEYSDREGIEVPEHLRQELKDSQASPDMTADHWPPELLYPDVY